MPQRHQGKTRLRIEPESAGGTKTFVRLVEAAAQPHDFALLIIGGTCMVFIRRRLQPLTRGGGFLNGVAPLAVERQYFRAMYKATPGEGDQLGLLGAPGCQGLGPFPRPVEDLEFLVRFDHAAINQARGDRRELPFGRSQHRLIQKRDPLMHCA